MTHEDREYQYEHLELLKTSRHRPNAYYAPYYNVKNGGKNHWKISFSFRESSSRAVPDMSEFEHYFKTNLKPKYFNFVGN